MNPKLVLELKPVAGAPLVDLVYVDGSKDRLEASGLSYDQLLAVVEQKTLDIQVIDEEKGTAREGVEEIEPDLRAT
jgi:hypothetical protein